MGETAPTESRSMASLTAHEVEQLVSLRLALEDARLQARRAGTYRRGAAIVALDAAVERATALVAFTRGIRVTPTTKLDDLISHLKESLGTMWAPTVLPDIKHLRRARNAVQHEALRTLLCSRVGARLRPRQGRNVSPRGSVRECSNILF